MLKILPIHTEAVQQKHPNVTTEAVLQSAGAALRGVKNWGGGEANGPTGNFKTTTM